MRKAYQVVSQSERAEVREYLAEHGHALLPVIEVIASGAQAVEELIAELGQVALQAVLQLSADEVAGPPHPGVPGGAIRRHGRQGGVVALGCQKVRVEKPRLRRREGGQGAEVPIPAYATMQSEEGLGKRVRSILLRGVSTRHYEAVVPEVAGRCGVSKSAISRESQEASAEALKELCERRFEELDLPILYIDGKHFGGHQVICAVGADAHPIKQRHHLALADPQPAHFLQQSANLFHRHPVAPMQHRHPGLHTHPKAPLPLYPQRLRCQSREHAPPAHPTAARYHQALNHAHLRRYQFDHLAPAMHPSALQLPSALRAARHRMRLDLIGLLSPTPFAGPLLAITCLPLAFVGICPDLDVLSHG